MASPGEPPERADRRRAGRPGRRRRSWLAGAVLLVAIAAAALAYWREPVAGVALRFWLDRAGYDGAEFTVADVALWRLRLTGIRLGPELAIADAAVEFDLSCLFGRPVTKLSLDGVRLDLAGAEGPLRRRLAQRPTAEGRGMTLRAALDAAAALPDIAIRDFTAAVPAGGQPVVLSGSLDAGRNPTGIYAGRFAVRLARGTRGEGPALQVNGTARLGRALSSLEATLASETGAATGSVRLHGEASQDQAAITATAGLAIDDPAGLSALVPALAGAGGTLHVTAKTAAPPVVPLDTPLDRAGFADILRRIGTSGVTLEAMIENARHPAGLAGLGGKLTAAARTAGDGARGTQIDGRIALRADEIAAGGARLTELALDGPLRIDLADDALVLVLPEPARLAAATVATADGTMATGPLAITVDGGRSHALRFSLSSLAPQPDVRLRLDVAAFRLQPMRTGAPRAVEVAPFVLRLAGTTDADGALRLHMQVPAVSAARAGRTATAEEIALSLRKAGNSLTGELAGRISVQQAGKPLVAPVALRSEFALWRDILTFEGKAEAAGPVTVSARGRHDFITGSGMADLSLAPVRFGPGGAALARLAPGLALPEIRAGTVQGSAHVPWGPDAPAGSATLRAEGLTLNAGGVSAEGVSTEITLDGLAPPRTPPGQTLRARRIAAGVALDDLLLRFRLVAGEAPGTAAMMIDTLTARFAGGALSVPATRIDPAADTSRARIEVRDMDLGVLLGLLGLEGVSGTGRLSGAIPVVLSGNAVAIEDGRLAAAGPGVLRVRSEAAKAALAQGGKEVTMMLRALEDFRYESLALEIDKALAGEGSLVVRTRGLNPEVGDGQPFIINLNVSADMDRLAAVAAQVLQLPGAVLRSIVPGAP